MARKSSKVASKSVKSAMRRRKKGTLRSGSGKKVTNPKQAIAIGLSEARKKGAKVPPRKTAGARRGSGRSTARRRSTSSGRTGAKRGRPRARRK